MATESIVLPDVVGTRPAARVFLSQVPAQLAGRTVVLDCTWLVDGTASFADEVVKVILADRQADLLVAVEPTDDFAADLQTAASVHGVANRFKIQRVPAPAER